MAVVTTKVHQKIFEQINVSDSARVHIGDVVHAGDAEEIQYRRFVDSLIFDSIHVREESIRASHDDTFDWILSRGPFRDWLERADDHEIFWLRGKVGSGKSTLVNFLCGDSHNYKFAEWLSSEVIILKYFFWELGPPSTRTVQSCLRSILWQFFNYHEQKGFRVWLSAVNNIRGSSLWVESAWTLNRLKRVLEYVFRETNSMFLSFFDGLDECSEQAQMLQQLQNLRPIHNLRICASSRPERKFELAFKGAPYLKLEDETSSDMYTFAHAELRRFAESWRMLIGPSDSEYHKVIKTLVYKADGVFAWLQVVVRSLQEGMENYDDWSTLQERIEELPSEISDLYAHMISRSGQNLKRYAASAAEIFKLVLLAHELSETITLAEMCWALNDKVRKRLFAGQPDASSVNSQYEELQLETTRTWTVTRCAYLLECWGCDYTDPKSAVRFIHKSVRDFLLDTEKGQRLLLDSSHNDIQIKLAYGEARLLSVIVDFGQRYLLKSKGVETVLKLMEYHPECHQRCEFLEICLMNSIQMRDLHRSATDNAWFCSYMVGAPDGLVYPPEHPDGWLFWLVSHQWLRYVHRVVLDHRRVLQKSTPTMLLFLTVSVWSQCDPSKHPPRPTQNDVVDFVLLLLQSGANVNARLNEMEGCFLSWIPRPASIPFGPEHRPTVLLYALLLTHLAEHQGRGVAGMHCLLEVVSLLIDHGACTNGQALSVPKWDLDFEKHSQPVSVERILSSIREHLAQHRCDPETCKSQKVLDAVSQETNKL